MASTTTGGHEDPTLTKLLTTFRLNKVTTDMTPNYHSSFRRNLKPAIFPQTGSPTSDTEKLTQLPNLWECTLHRILESRVYNGSPASARKFREMTGLTPERFAQAWLESEGCVWRYFHPTKSGKEVAVAMCEFWRDKTKEWRSRSDDREIAREIVQMVGVQGLKDVKKLIDKELPCVMAVNGKKKEITAMLRHFKIVSQPDCQAHPWASVCNCAVALDIPIMYERNLTVNFVKGFDAQLLHADEAFLYTADVASATLFKVRTGGQTVEGFAGEVVEGLSAIPFWELQGSKKELIDAMLAYWAYKVRFWRETCKTRAEVRTRGYEDRVEDRGMRVTDRATGISRPIDPHEDPAIDPLCRYLRLQGPSGHRGTMVLYAKYGKEGDGDFGYDVLRRTPCHKECAHRVTNVDLRELTKDVVDEDYAKAKAVKVEW